MNASGCDSVGLYSNLVAELFHSDLDAASCDMLPDMSWAERGALNLEPPGGQRGPDNIQKSLKSSRRCRQPSDTLWRGSLTRARSAPCCLSRVLFPSPLSISAGGDGFQPLRR